MVGSFTFYLELVLLGLKPGTTPSVPAEVEDRKTVMKEIGFHFKRVELKFVDLDNLPEYARDLEYHRPYFVAREKKKLELLGESYGESEKGKYNRDFAVFLGYPEEDIEWFMKQDKDVGEIKQLSRKELGNPADFEFVTSTIAYIPKPTQKSYKRAERRAKKYIKAIREADRQFGSEVGRKLIQVQCEDIPEI